jgi:hypothetical protein
MTVLADLAARTADDELLGLRDAIAEAQLDQPLARPSERALARFVEPASRLLRSSEEPNHGEAHADPAIRAELVRLGLLDAAGVPTEAGSADAEDASVLWDVLATGIRSRDTDAETLAAVFLLFAVAARTADGEASYLAVVTSGLRSVGVTEHDGRPITDDVALELVQGPLAVLRALGAFAEGADAWRPGSLMGAAFARYSLRR